MEKVRGDPTAAAAFAANIQGPDINVPSYSGVAIPLPDGQVMSADITANPENRAGGAGGAGNGGGLQGRAQLGGQHHLLLYDAGQGVLYALVDPEHLVQRGRLKVRRVSPQKAWLAMALPVPLAPLGPPDPPDPTPQLPQPSAVISADMTWPSGKGSATPE